MLWPSVAGALFLCALAWNSCHPLGILPPLFTPPPRATRLSPPLALVPPAAGDGAAAAEGSAAANSAAAAATTAKSSSSSSSSSSGRQYAYVLAASNHKTGTYQLDCITEAFQIATKLPRVWRPEAATGEELLAPLLVLPPRPPHQPQLIGAGHAVIQSCYGRRQVPTPGIFRCPTQHLPCNAEGAATLSLDGCLLALPAMLHGASGLLHFYRNPWDVVTSAYWYHSQDPVPQGEGWLHISMAETANVITSQGVPRSALEALGVLEPDKRAQSFAEVLRGLPDEQGVQLQFWYSAIELYTMARQFLIFKGVPGAVQIRFEDAQANLEAAMRPAMHEFYPQDEERFLQAIRDHKCDPSLWTEADLAQSDHVTHAKRAPEAKQHLQRVLWEQAPIRQHLCGLSSAMGYESPAPCLGDPRETADTDPGQLVAAAAA